MTIRTSLPPAGICNAIKGHRPFGSFQEAKDYVLQRRQELEETFMKVVAEVRGKA